MNSLVSPEQERIASCVLLDDFIERAKGCLPKASFDYIDACAMDGVTYRANRADFDRLAFSPLAMRAVAAPDPATSYFGRTHDVPIGISPMAFHQLAHPEGELATASAAQAAGAPIVVSSMSSRSLEEIAKHARGARLWLHVYLFRNRDVTRRLIARAQDAGFEAITVGLGCPALGKRPVNLRNAFTLPDGVGAANFSRNPSDPTALSWVDAELDPSATWSDIEALCRHTSLPLIGKGIMNPLDVPPALNAGLSGLMVSNHGGRQLDGCVSSIRALPDIVAAAAGRVPVFLDSGVRRGTDALKALSLGASAVFVGRPALWALSVNGEQGVIDMLSILKDELRLAMQLVGCANLKDARALAPDILRWT
ncbi:alpha-hydroxy acid oxidase [Massilia pseudoviolaceinigra]|uniref:alpha-hydroxy acid oxidase n=1 Tax=Massilia pseudoviolaceinigra TaxID=3057165 RepID=UPI0027966329|nr:alpha-hydroxy acid oxidase [Massilia sp. CCM 9206]MDQ1920919.1 alpha-hydroxy acid oxidase [Massilia sp. CCM 9206]